MAEPRRTATLLAVARQLETDACDDMLDLLDRLLAGLLTRTQRIEQRDRLRGLPALDVAARQLRDAVTVLLDPPDSGAGVLSAVWSVLEERDISRDQLTDAVHAVGELSREPASWAEELLSRYSHVRRFMPALLDGLHLGATAGGQPVAIALGALRDLEGRRRVLAEEVPLELVTGVWRRLVTGADGLLDRRAYTFCMLERLREALRRRDVFAPASSRWADPRAQLLTGHAGEGAREEVCRSLGHDASADRELAELTGELDTAYRAVAARLPENTAVRVETSTAGTGRCSPRWTASMSHPACSPCGRRSPFCCRASTCPTCCWRSPTGRGSPSSSPRLRKDQPCRGPAPVGLCGARRPGLQHRSRTARRARPASADPRQAVLGGAELPAHRHHHRGQHPARRRPDRHRPGPRLGWRRGRLR